MKILHLAKHENSGAGRAASRLHEGLLENHHYRSGQALGQTGHLLDAKLREIRDRVCAFVVAA